NGEPHHRPRPGRRGAAASAVSTGLMTGPRIPAERFVMLSGAGQARPRSGVRPRLEADASTMSPPRPSNPVGGPPPKALKQEMVSATGGRTSCRTPRPSRPEEPPHRLAVDRRHRQVTPRQPKEIKP